MFDPTSDFQNQNLGLTSTLPYNNQSFGDLQDLMTDFVNHSSLVGETTQQYLITALQEAQIILQSFAQSSTKDVILEEAFGVNYNQENADILLNNIAQNNFNGTPEIKVIDSDILVNANGAYSHKINTIFLADEFVKNSDSQAIIGVILEEFGHYIDSLINIKDSTGDEGDIFSRLVRGESIDSAELALLKQENDSAFINYNGQLMIIAPQK